jgi:hypothetical protein
MCPPELCHLPRLNMPNTPTPFPERPSVLRFMDLHLQQGGLEQHSYEMLRGVIRMINRISRLLFPHSHVFREDIKRQVISLCDGIEETCAMFGEHLVTSCNGAVDARDGLPTIVSQREDVFYEHMRQWAETLQ